MSYEVVTFLSMNGRGEEAIDFYTKHLNAKVLYKVTFEALQKRVPSKVFEAGKEQWVAHSVLQVGSHQLMLAEEVMTPNLDYMVGNNFSLCLRYGDKAEVEEIYNSLSQDPKTEVIMPLGENYFSELYGVVKDPFGVSLQLMYDKRAKK